MEFRQTVAEIMDLAASYSRKKDAAMARRTEALKELAQTASAWVDGNSQIPLHATGGGTMGSVSPLPWMRIYSSKHSPKATAGFYLVYLFDATGGSVFLTLHQGTSRFDGNHWRPVKDANVLKTSAADARNSLESMGADLTWSDGHPIDLGIDHWMEEGRHVARETRLNARNYTAARIASRRYLRGELPEDGQWHSDLIEALPSLLALYGLEAADRPTKDAGTELLGRPRGSWGRLKSRAEIDAVDRRAMLMATEHYVSRGWSVQDVSMLASYDLRCLRGDEELRVEVKGTTMRILEQIELTANEVDLCRTFGRMELALISGIELDRSQEVPTASGGTIDVRSPWTILADDRRLAATRYIYRLGDEAAAPEHSCGCRCRWRRGAVGLRTRGERGREASGTRSPPVLTGHRFGDHAHTHRSSGVYDRRRRRGAPGRRNRRVFTPVLAAGRLRYHRIGAGNPNSESEEPMRTEDSGCGGCITIILWFALPFILWGVWGIACDGAPSPSTGAYQPTPTSSGTEPPGSLDASDPSSSGGGSGGGSDGSGEFDTGAREDPAADARAKQENYDSGYEQGYEAGSGGEAGSRPSGMDQGEMSRWESGFEQGYEAGQR